MHMPSTRIMQKALFFGADFTVAAPQFYDMKRNVSKKVQHTPIAGARVRRPLYPPSFQLTNT
jgi:ornithine carbamoyltransferase